MLLSFRLWGGPPGPRPAPWPATPADFKRIAGPGGPARTRGSAPLDYSRAPAFENEVASCASQHARLGGHQFLEFIRLAELGEVRLFHQLLALLESFFESH